MGRFSVTKAFQLQRDEGAADGLRRLASERAERAAARLRDAAAASSPTRSTPPAKT